MKQIAHLSAATTLALMGAEPIADATAALALMGAAPIIDATASAPEWVHLLPAGTDGQIQTSDARGPYHLTDPAAVIAASFANADRLPIDENHSTDLAAPNGLPAPARGWIVAMESRPDGIWGRVEWTAEGQSLVSGKAYRGISPVILHDKTKAIGRVLRASLVNAPNLRGLTALHMETTMTFMEKIAKMLGLAATATQAEILSALEKEMTDDPGEGKGGATAATQASISAIGVALGVAENATTEAIIAAAQAAKSAKPAEITALQSEIAALTTRINSDASVQAQKAATAFVDGEIAKGRVGVKPLRDHYIAMHAADAARVEKEIGAMPILGRSGTIAVPPAAKDGEVALNAEELTAAKLLGLDPKAYAATLKAERTNEEAL